MTLVFARTIAVWFALDAEALRLGTSCLRIIAVGFPLYDIGMVMVQAMNGAGDTEAPLTLNLVAFWFVQIPLPFTLATRTPLGANGVFIAEVVAESLLTIMSIIVFRRGGWKTHEA